MDAQLKPTPGLRRNMSFATCIDRIKGFHGIDRHRARNRAWSDLSWRGKKTIYTVIDKRSRLAIEYIFEGDRFVTARAV